MGVFKNKVGRPSNKIIRVRRLIITGIIISFVLAIILTVNSGVLSSTKKLKGSAYNVKGDSCSFHVINIKSTSAQAYWNCSSGGLSSFTVYSSNSNGNVGRAVYGPHIPLQYKQASMKTVKSGLISDHWYLISYKTINDKIFNIKFKTPKEGTTNPVTVNKTRVTIDENKIGKTSVEVFYNGISTYAEEIHIYEKKKDGSRGRQVVNSKIKSQYDTKTFGGLANGRKYIVDVKFDNGKTVTKKFKTIDPGYEYDVYGDFCSFHIINIKKNKAEAYWVCDKGGVSSFSVYDSNSSGEIGRKVFGKRPTEYNQMATWSVNSGLVPGNWYVISYKTFLNGIFNIKFKTPSNNETKNPYDVNRRRMKIHVDHRNAAIEYTAVSLYVTKIELYYNGGRLIRDYTPISSARQDGVLYINNLSKNTEYKVRLIYDDGSSKSDKFKTTN